ncbi:hypothetical protein F5144DRAFT_601716 [Chaetomium tenue]|uniref:Uncharacterized protein n=1 Tax=Chaetomium tenue TaxID=1854479 RepID=A0ACB7PJ15_9PEZI|nr:hypothetical protein F5144DRAFT_601716 [Chaetomium globosum]
MNKQSHIERTAHEPREATLHTLTIAHIEQVSPTIRVIRLAIPPNDNITATPGSQFLPGQWVDLHPPPEAQVPKAGGFTITSSPTLALPHSTPSPSSTKQPPPTNPPAPYLELAIQSSPHNPPAAYLFQPTPRLLHTPVQVRIGGSFVFPPPFLRHTTTTNPNHTTTATPLPKIVLVAGGMGINPLMSMLIRIAEESESMYEEGEEEEGPEVRVLYGVKDPGGGDGGGGAILFLERIAGLFARGRVLRGGVRLFVTGGGDGGGGVGSGWWGVGEVGSGGEEVIKVPCLRRRMTVRDVEEAVGEEKDAAVVYVCGVPGMTDEFVQALVAPEGFGMDPKRVLFEKWW